MSHEIDFFRSTSKSLLPVKGRHPYYIVVARYVRTSAGIRALHILCHWLNRIGYNAFVLIYPDFQYKNQTNPYLATPVLTEAIIEAHHEAGLTPIVIYPEVVNGNPFEATAKVVFLGHYPGRLGGPAAYDETYLLFSYSQSIAKETSQPDNIIHIPVIDTGIFYDRKFESRESTCFYAGKFKNYFGGTVYGIPDDCIEITRDKPDSQNANEIADLFCRSKVFYCFEDSALILEALICNCPVVLMPNDFFSKPIGIDEIGWDGIAWGASSAEVARAVSTVEKGKNNYVQQISKFFDQLDNFITKTQLHAIQNPQPAPVQVPHLTDAFSNTFALSDENLIKLGDLILANSKERENLSQSEDLLWSHEMNTFRAKGLISLRKGWVNNFGDEIWSSGPEAVLEIVYDEKYSSIQLNLQSFCGPDQSRNYFFNINGVEFGNVSVPVWGRHVLKIPRDEVVFGDDSRLMRLEIRHDPVGSPSQLWGGPDVRQIGIRLLWIAARHS